MILLSLRSNCIAQTTVDDVKKEANKLFEDDEFFGAYKLYAQLVANYPKDPVYNFRLGVCMIYSEPDKKKCISYLKYANSQGEEAPKETKFYLGKAYHINYMFDEAIKYYNEFKRVGSSSSQKKLQVDREIKACAYGKRLLSNLSDLVVISKKTLNEADYFRSYDLKDIGGKLLAKPEEFRTAPDKKKKDKSILYKPKVGERVYYSSYGPNTETGRDIYYKTFMANGQFGPAEKVKGINTEFDEDYPFLHPNGKTLYFASKGYNSMGGYDIFKSTYIEANDSWSQPVNMEFPINSPDDDFLFVTDSLEKTAYFSTGRQSLPGKIDVLKINTERKPIDILALKGTIVKESSDQSIKSKITVKNMDNGEIVGTYEAQDNGDYLMDLPNGSKLLFTVETPGLQTQSDKVSLPMVTSSKPLKQTISYEKGILKIINYFDEAPSDDSYVQYLKIIEQKAKLNVNVGENKFAPVVEDKKDTTAQKGLGNTNDTSGPTLVDNNDSSKNNTANNSTITTNADNKGVDNKQLSALAKQDAEESKKEAIALQQDANDALELGNAKKIEADKKSNEAQEALKNAESISNEAEKKSAIEKAIAIKTDAENEQNSANKILTYAKALQTDAKGKQIEADLNEKYSKELEKVISSKNTNKEALTQLDDLQKQIETASSKKYESENIYNEIKNDVDEKEKEISKIEQINSDVKSNLQEIKSEISSSENELANTKKKKDKEPIQNKINELKIEQDEKEKQIAGNEIKIEQLKNELASLKGNLDLANKIKNENIAAPIAQNNTPANTDNKVTNNNKNNDNPDKITSAILSEKYKEKIIVSDNNDKSNLEQVNTELKNYNKELDATITKNKSDLAKTKNANSKTAINNEIKQLEAIKKQNQQQITSNNKQITELDKKSILAAKNTGPSLNPINSNNSSDALKQLTELDSKLNTNDNSNFEYNGYQNPEAQNLKVEADAKINEAAAQQKKLKDLIANTSTEIKNTPQPANISSAKNVNELNKEYEELTVKAQEQRTEAESKTGAEKDELIAKAKQNEKLAEEKHLAAAEMQKSDNQAVFNTNNENIEAISKLNKASEMDLAEVKKLTDEANINFKKAISIREEANSMTNIGAKLGNYSNAEEIEAEALSKQEQALFILKKTSGNVTLKTPVTSINSSTVAAASSGSVDLTQQLKNVNDGIGELSNSKISAYQKLFDANKSELNTLNSNLKNNQSLIDKTPASKSDFISANNKINKAEGIKQNSDSENDNNKKLNDLITATKIQIEAINQLSNLTKNINQSVVTSKVETNTDKTNDPVNNTEKQNVADTKSVNTVNTTTDNVAANNDNNNEKQNVSDTKSVNVVNTTTDNVAANNDNNTEKQNITDTKSVNAVNTSTNNIAENNENNNEKQNIENKGTENKSETNPATIIDVNELAKSDTSTSQVLNFFENNKINLNNAGANELAKQTLDELKKINEEKTTIEQQLNSSTTGTGSSQNTENPTQLQGKAETLLVEAEELSVKAFEMKTEANSKSGSEKEKLTASALALEEQSLNKKLEASTLTEKANESFYATNKKAIEDLLGKLKTDNPELASELEQKNNDLSVLKTQGAQLRNEGNSLTNNNAKIGALMNAEEKETEMLQKQNDILNQLKNKYPDYVIEQPAITNTNINTEELKQKQIQLQENEFSALTKLTNAFSLEYETSKNNVPENLTDNQKAIKTNAEQLNSESRKLLIQSEKETNVNQKLKLLTLAAKSGNASIAQLKTLNTVDKSLASNKTNNTVKNKTESKNNNTVNNQNKNNVVTNKKTKTNTENNVNPVIENNAVNENKNTNKAGKATIKIEGLEVIAGNAYNANKPIPIDAKMPDGLVFRVQIGAFKTKLADNAFRGLSPVNGENASNGYIRYTAGNFNKIENANAVKNDLKGLGYSDAFVVVYYNGKRISVNEALAILAQEGKTIDNNAPATAGITEKANIPKAVVNPANPNLNVGEIVSVTKELEQMNGLLFTVQIGVYTKQITKKQLFNLQPIYSEKLPTGLYRYTAGIYNNAEKLLTDKSRVVGLGVRDAFASAYLNGKKISFADAKIAQQDSSTRMETENPIIFPSENLNNTQTNNPGPANNPAPALNTTVQPFSNGVSSYPEATAENGIKTTQEGICFKVQIGAYSKQVPTDVAAKFSSIRTWPIENKQINNLFIYNIGNFSSAKFAKTLKDEAVRFGINDAFITVYKDGQKVPAAEAAILLNQ